MQKNTDPLDIEQVANGVVYPITKETITKVVATSRVWLRKLWVYRMAITARRPLRSTKNVE